LHDSLHPVISKKPRFCALLLAEWKKVHCLHLINTTKLFTLCFWLVPEKFRDCPRKFLCYSGLGGWGCSFAVYPRLVHLWSCQYQQLYHLCFHCFYSADPFQSRLMVLFCIILMHIGNSALHLTLGVSKACHTGPEIHCLWPITTYDTQTRKKLRALQIGVVA